MHQSLDVNNVDSSDLIFGASTDDNFLNIEDLLDTVEHKRNQVDVDSVFTNRSKWPEGSARYFLKEHNNPGDGKRVSCSTVS